MPTVDFTRLMQLTPDGDDRFLAPLAPEPGERMFGGQFLAQGLMAARQTIEPDRRCHSLHAYFLRPGDVESPVVFGVERIRDGRSFSAREVRAEQGGKEMFRMVLSFQAPPADDLRFAATPDMTLPAPDAVDYTYVDFTHDLRPDYEGAWPGAQRPMDIRYINPPAAPRGTPVLEDQRMWMRIDSTLAANDHGLHEAGLAYLSDSTLVDQVLLPHGRRWQEVDFGGASLDHAMWFYGSSPADEWLLFDQRVEATGNERGLATGRFYTRSGALVAHCTQEGLVRWET